MQSTKTDGVLLGRNALVFAQMGLEIVLLQQAMDGHVGHAGSEAEFDGLVGEQAQDPAGEALGDVGIGEGEQPALNWLSRTISREGRIWGL